MVKSYFSYLITGVLVSATFGAGLIASSVQVGASEETSDTFNINVPSICTMGGTIGTGEAHTTSLQPGTYVPNIGKTTMSVHCNDSEGFSIYAVGFTGDQSTGENHTKLVGNNTNNTISTGTTTGSSESDASSWAMKITAVNGTYKPTVPDGTGGTQNFTSYHAVPEEYTKIASFNSNTDAEGQGSVGSNIETTYAVYVNLEQATDTYTGKVKYTLVHPANHVSPDTAEYNTTVTLGTNVKTVTFESDGTETQTVKTSGSSVSLYDGVTYTITAATDNGYELASWTTNEYGTIGNTTQNPTTFTATGTTTLTATAQVQLPEHTCTKEYRLQNADGTYPSTYTSDGTETLRQGSTCTYTKSIENYQTQTDTATMTTDQTISLDLPRNTYELTINKDSTHIATVTGAGTHRWGETVNITATPASGSRFTTWTQTSGTTSTFGNATSATTIFTMPTSAATISAGGETIPTYTVTVTLDSNTSSVSFYNADYGTQNVTTNGGAVSLRDGIQYTITATFANDYKLDHWTAGSNATVGSTTTNPTTLTITSATTLSVTSKVDAPEPQPSTAGCINYFANASNAVGTMGCQSATDGNSIELLASNFSRTGYGFAGWSDSYDYATNQNAKFYGPQETITVPAGTTANGLSLYAVWIQSQGSLQNSSTVASVCNSLTTAPTNGTANLSSVSALTDQRDNNTYAIAKLADGKCWMIENLRLADKDSSNNDILLSASNTNSPSLPLTNDYANSTTSNHLSASINPTTTAWCTTVSAACYDQSMLYTGNTTERATTPAATDSNTYSYGNYYNWYSATAGNGTYSKSSGNTTGDICPNGWRLPTGSSTGEFYTLNTVANSGSTSASTGLRAYPTNFLYSGYVLGSSVSYRGSYGYYWSKSAYYSLNAYNLYFNSSYVNPSNSSGKGLGYSVRCLAEVSTPTAQTLTVSLDSHVTSVTFSDGTNPDQTVTTNGGTVNLIPNTSYTITATTASGYEFSSWTPGTGATLGSNNTNPTTLTVTSDTTLSVSSQQIPSYNVTVTLDSNTTSVGFYNADLGTQNVTTNGGTATLRSGVEYIITATFANGYALDHWTAGSNAAVGSTTANPTTLTITSATTLSVTSQQQYTPEPQPSTARCINYFANASNAVGTMGCQSATDGQSKTLLASNFSRTGYGFAGWSDSYDYATNQNAKFYGPMETITVPTGTTANGLSLYAVWIESQGSLQNSSTVASVCNSLTAAPIDGTANLSSVSALTDQRDNQTYAIAKLADGKCWMIENLRLDNTAELTTTNTNNPLNDGTNVTLKHNYTDTDTHNTLSSTSAVAYNADTAPDGWCTTSSAACYDQSRLRTDNTANRATGNPGVNTGSMYSYGNYYNWYSATAGNGTYRKSSGETAGDLCPSGWKLPYGNSTGNGNTSGGFYYLNYKINNDTNATDSNASKNLRAFPNNFLYSGYVNGGSLDGRGGYGDYWSSTANSSSSAYYLEVASAGVRPGTYNDIKYHGRAVRCLASS